MLGWKCLQDTKLRADFGWASMAKTEKRFITLTSTKFHSCCWKTQRNSPSVFKSVKIWKRLIEMLPAEWCSTRVGSHFANEKWDWMKMPTRHTAQSWLYLSVNDEGIKRLRTLTSTKFHSCCCKTRRSSPSFCKSFKNCVFFSLKKRRYKKGRSWRL